VAIAAGALILYFAARRWIARRAVQSGELELPDEYRDRIERDLKELE
jgi:hypothetical protein